MILRAHSSLLTTWEVRRILERQSPSSIRTEIPKLDLRVFPHLPKILPKSLSALTSPSCSVPKILCYESPSTWLSSFQSIASVIGRSASFSRFVLPFPSCPHGFPIIAVIPMDKMSVYVGNCVGVVSPNVSFVVFS